MFGLKKKKTAALLTCDDPVYSGRDALGQWNYILNHGSNIDAYFDGIDIPRERLLDENEWFDIHTAVKLWKNYRKCLHDYDMTETFNLTFESVQRSSYGIAKLVSQFSSVKLLVKLIPQLISTVSKIDIFKIVELENDSAIVEYCAAPGFRQFVQSSHVFGFSGVLSAIPTVHNMPGADVREAASLIDVFKKFTHDFAQFNYRIEEKEGIIYLNGRPAGKWINILPDSPGLHPFVKKHLSGERCVLWEIDVKEKKKAGNKIIIAKKGDLYNCSRSLFILKWENAGFYSRMKNVLPIARQYISAFVESRESLFKQTSALRNQTGILEKRIQETTEKLSKAHREILELERNSLEHSFTGGFADKMIHTLSRAESDIKSIADENKPGESSRLYFKNILRRLLENLEKISREFEVPEETIKALFIPRIKELNYISNHLADIVDGVSGDISKGLKISNEIKNYSHTYEINPGSDVIDILKIITEYQLKYKSEFKRHDIEYSVSANSLSKAFIKGDKEHINAIFTNLIFNARDSLIESEREKGSILVSVEKCESEPDTAFDYSDTAFDYIVKVSDNGSGIEQNHLHDIFKPFFTTRPQGTGLGLSIVKRLVELYKGRITIESETGKGTVVSCFLHSDRRLDNDENHLTKSFLRDIFQ